MTFELIVNILLALGAVFSYFYVGSTMPESSNLELGAEQWPQGILILLLIALAWNIYQIIKKNRAAGIPFNIKALTEGASKFIKSRLFIAMALVVVMAFVINIFGFFLVSILFLAVYGYLIGERRPWKLVVFPVVITFLLYTGFSVFLSVMLPRGTIPFLRNFSLFIESLVRL
ncbi:MAG: tripartite tricarboxylate transporter TctB family protein [Clostridia bacterium]